MTLQDVQLPGSLTRAMLCCAEALGSSAGTSWRLGMGLCIIGLPVMGVAFLLHARLSIHHSTTRRACPGHVWSLSA